MNTVRILPVCMAAMLVAGLFAAAPAAAADLATQIRQLTGAETRIVWLRNKQWETKNSTFNPVDGVVGCSIMAFDTGSTSLA